MENSGQKVPNVMTDEAIEKLVSVDQKNFHFSAENRAEGRAKREINFGRRPRPTFKNCEMTM